MSAAESASSNLKGERFPTPCIELIRLRCHVDCTVYFLPLSPTFNALARVARVARASVAMAPLPRPHCSTRCSGKSYCHPSLTIYTADDATDEELLTPLMDKPEESEEQSLAIRASTPSVKRMDSKLHPDEIEVLNDMYHTIFTDKEAMAEHMDDKIDPSAKHYYGEAQFFLHFV